jgi:hypothetical protein
MKILARALLVAAALVAAVPSGARPLQTGNTRFTALEFPLSITSTDQGTFTGTLAIRGFAVENNALVAIGRLTGTLTDEGGLVTSSMRTVTIPVSTVTPPTITCDSVLLTLAPADTDLSGLVAHVDAITIELGPAPPGDTLLRNLMCQAAHFLAQNKLPQLAFFLTRIMALVV